MHDLLHNFAIVCSPQLMACSSAESIEALLLRGLLDLLNKLLDKLLDVRMAMPAPTPAVVLEPSVYISMSVLCLWCRNSDIS